MINAFKCSFRHNESVFSKQQWRANGVCSSNENKSDISLLSVTSRTTLQTPLATMPSYTVFLKIFSAFVRLNTVGRCFEKKIPKILFLQNNSKYFKKVTNK